MLSYTWQQQWKREGERERGEPYAMRHRQSHSLSLILILIPARNFTSVCLMQPAGSANVCKLHLGDLQAERGGRERKGGTFVCSHVAKLIQFVWGSKSILWLMILLERAKHLTSWHRPSCWLNYAASLDSQCKRINYIVHRNKKTVNWRQQNRFDATIICPELWRIYLFNN